jgi:hypothetical protein
VKGATLRQRMDRGGGKFADRPLLGLSSSSAPSAPPAPSASRASASAAATDGVVTAVVEPRGFDPQLLSNDAGDDCCFEEARAARWAARRDSKNETATTTTVRNAYPSHPSLRTSTPPPRMQPACAVSHPAVARPRGAAQPSTPSEGSSLSPGKGASLNSTFS